MNVLITGGGGFIGSNIVRELADKGHNVRVLDDFSTGKRENLKSILDEIELIKGDIRDAELLRGAVRDIEIVLHQAALPSVARSLKDPLLTADVNINGTINVLTAARDSGVRRVVYASSSSVYGDTPTLPKVEDMPTTPLSPYAASKLAGEHYCRVYSEIHGLDTVSLRYFNVFGPRQDPTSQYSAVIPLFISALLGGSIPTVYGDGEQTRDFTFVGNVVNANVWALKAKKTKGEAVNIGCGSRVSLNQLLDMLNKITGKDITAKYDNARKGDVRHSLADISKAKKLIDYEPKVGLEDGLRETVKWFQRKGQ